MNKLYLILKIYIFIINSLFIFIFYHLNVYDHLNNFYTHVFYIYNIFYVFVQSKHNKNPFFWIFQNLEYDISYEIRATNLLPLPFYYFG